MQVVVNMISRTLDLKQVTQMIANSIAAELGYIGGVLSFVNADNKLRVKAVTENKQAKETIALLPKDIFHYEADLKGGYNFGVDTVLTAKINFSEHMTDFFSPPVDKNIIEAIQEKLGVKTIVGVPIFSEDRIIGVVHFLLSVEREKISPLDIEMMTSLTSQVGIVSRNLALYENLQKVNYDLNDANLHLKALDKAKSEFLSIASHQLRTPVSALKGYLSMMMEG
jgi:signal transduction histidine kinase